MECLGVHRDYVVEKFYKKQLSAIAVQYAFPSNVDWSTQHDLTSTRPHF